LMIANIWLSVNFDLRIENSLSLFK